MKKFLLIAALAAATVTAGAQNVKFYYQGNEVPKDGTVVFNEVEETPFGDYEIKPDIKLTATKQATIIVKVVCTTGQDVNLCFGGECGAASTTVSSRETIIGADQTLNLEYDYASESEIDYIVSTDVYVIDPISEAAINKITVTFDPNAQSVKGVSADEGIAYRNGSLIFNTSQATSFSLFDFAGKKVAESIVNGNGEFNTAALQHGVYVYKFGGKTGKIVVK